MKILVGALAGLVVGIIAWLLGFSGWLVFVAAVIAGFISGVVLDIIREEKGRKNEDHHRPVT